MNFAQPNENANTTPPEKGKLLIAGPFLSDPNFSRSVVLLCEHSSEGTIGFILNQPTALTLGDIVAGLELYMPPLVLYQGGPVQPDTLHIIHRIPEVLGGMPVAPGIYWGGSYEILQDIVKSNRYNERDLRLFIGYSGWTTGQLEREMKEGTWLVGDATPQLVFEDEAHTTWKKAIAALGKNFAYLANVPIDPQLN